MSMSRRDIGLLALSLGAYYLLKKKNKKRRWWVRSINRNRSQPGDYNNLIQEMRLNDPDMFFNYTRLTVEQFDNLLAEVGPLITKIGYRETVPAGARLTLTLRHLAAGDSIPSLAFGYRVGKSTACNIINETCDAIWAALYEKILKEPDKIGWKQIADGFENTWNLPNCAGALDGMHVSIRAPHNTGSLFFNYKKSFSIVLFAVCDSNYCFTYVDIGSYGSQSDGGILRLCSFGQKLRNNLLDLPEDVPFPGLTAFPLQINLMRPFGGKTLTLEERIYNYRISRARRCIENTFGIMVARFRIFNTTIYKNPENVDKIIKASVCLHNFIKKAEENMPASQRQYCTQAFADVEKDCVLVPGEWRKEVPQETALRSVSELGRRIGTRNHTQDATAYREYIKCYLNSDIGSVPWQNLTINK